MAKKLTEKYMVVSEYDCSEDSHTLEEAQETARIHFDNDEKLEEVSIYKLVGVMKLNIEFEKR